MIDEVKPMMRRLRDSEEWWSVGHGSHWDQNVEIGVPGIQTDRGDGGWIGAQRY